MVRIASSIVEVFVFSFDDDRPLYLLLHRSPAEKIYPGIWQSVTGSIETGETASEAALRELREETGLIPSAFWVVPHVSVFYDHSHDSMNLTSVFAAQVTPAARPKLSSEHYEYEWCDYRSAAAKLVWPGQRRGLQILDEYLIGGSPAAELSRIS